LGSWILFTQKEQQSFLGVREKDIKKIIFFEKRGVLGNSFLRIQPSL